MTTSSTGSVDAPTTPSTEPASPDRTYWERKLAYATMRHLAHVRCAEFLESASDLDHPADPYAQELREHRVEAEMRHAAAFRYYALLVEMHLNGVQS